MPATPTALGGCGRREGAGTAAVVGGEAQALAAGAPGTVSRHATASRRSPTAVSTRRSADSDSAVAVRCPLQPPPLILERVQKVITL
jgi:hypothetical protein